MTGRRGCVAGAPGADRRFDPGRAAQTDIAYAHLDSGNARYRAVETRLRRVRADLHLSGILVRDYLLDSSAPSGEYRSRLMALRNESARLIAELQPLVRERREDLAELVVQLVRQALSLFLLRPEKLIPQPAELLLGLLGPSVLRSDRRSGTRMRITATTRTAYSTISAVLWQPWR